MSLYTFDPNAPCVATLSVDKVAERLQICAGSVLRLIREGILPATQLMPSAPWQVPVAALDSEAVQIGVRAATPPAAPRPPPWGRIVCTSAPNSIPTRRSRG